MQGVPIRVIDRRFLMARTSIAVFLYGAQSASTDCEYSGKILRDLRKTQLSNAVKLPSQFASIPRDRADVDQISSASAQLHM